MKRNYLSSFPILLCLHFTIGHTAPRVPDQQFPPKDLVYHEMSNSAATGRGGGSGSSSILKLELEEGKDFKVTTIHDPNSKGKKVEIMRPTIFKTEETHLIYTSQTGRLVLAGVMGVCIGLFSGFVLTVVACCCYLKFSSSGYGNLQFDKHNNTYRSAELIDGII